MKKKKPEKRKKAKAISAYKKGRRTSPTLIHRNRKDLVLKNYLMEDHPELGESFADAESTKVDRVPMVAKH
jgi:hypothetical protein